MNIYNEALDKLEKTLTVLKHSDSYEKHMREVMESLDQGLKYTKEHYSELNGGSLFLKDVTRGADVYFFCMRFSHQFFNVMTLISIMPNATYYQRAQHILSIRQSKFEELCKEAITKAISLLEQAQTTAS